MTPCHLPKKLVLHRGATRRGSTPHYRWAFFEALAREVGRPVENAGPPPTLCWPSASGGFDQVQVIKKLEPESLHSKRPHVLRIGLNSHAFAYGRWKPKTFPPDFQQPSRRWKFELTVLAAELLDFAPWIAALARAHEANSAEGLAAPPHPCRFWFNGTPILDVNYGWTATAWEAHHGYLGRVRPCLWRRSALSTVGGTAADAAREALEPGIPHPTAERSTPAV